MIDADGIKPKPYFDAIISRSINPKAFIGEIQEREELPMEQRVRRD